MADVTEVIKRLIVEAQTRGLDKAAADFEKFGTAAKQAATTSENALASTGRSFERLAGSIDPARKQLQLLAKDLATLESGRGRAGVSDEYINGLKEARTASAALAIEATKTNAVIGAQANGFAKMGPAVGLARHEMINFGRQAQDVFVQLASGQSAIMTLVQQGPQIADVFMTSRTTLSGFMEQVGSAAARFGPLVIAITAVGTALYAVNKAMDEQADARRALTGGPGRFLGATPDDIAAAARRTAGGGVSLGEAREGILGGVRAGGPDLQTIEQAGRLAERYAATLKTELVPAQKELNDLIGDRTTKSYTAVSQKLGIYNAEVADNIRNLQSQGRFGEAARAGLEGITGALVKNAEAAGFAAREWAIFKSEGEAALNFLGKLGPAAAKSQQQILDARIDAARSQRDALSGRSTLGISGEAAAGAVGRDVTSLENERFAQARVRETTANRADAEQEALRQINIAKAIKDATKAQQDQIEVLNALTIAQKAAATETQVYNQLVDQGKSVEEARARAVLASQMVIAQAANEMTRAIQAQQNQLSALRQQQSAVTGGAGETELAVLNAKLQEKNSLLAQGVDLASKEAQQRIANAGAIARETAALQDQIAARNILKQAAVESAGLRADLALAGEEQSIRTAAIETAKLQVQVEQLLADGKTQEAAATAAARTEIIQLTYARDLDAEAARDEADAIARKNARLHEEAQAQDAVAAARSRATASAEAGFAKASTFSTPWAKKGQESSITAPPGYEVQLTGTTHGARAGGGLGYKVSYVKGKELLEQEAQQATAAQEKRAGGVKQQSDLARQTLGTAISTANSALGKQIEALRDATERSTDAQDRRTELEGKLKEQEDKRQSRIQNYLAAGPSPFEQNADIFYDPKKRIAFAESIAGGIDEQLKVQIAAARAEEDAADAAQESAEAQIEKLEAQQEALQYQSELLSAGVDLSKAEVDGINALINEIKSGLPENIATQFARISQAQMGQATQQAKDIEKATGVGSGSYAMQTATAGAGGGSATGSSSAFTYDPFSLSTTNIRRGTIGGFASGGEFTVPGSYGAGDRPFVMGLAGQEKVTIQTPGQQRSGGSRGTSIENLIVQMPPMTDPIVYLNKRSRPALGRAIRNTARGMS